MEDFHLQSVNERVGGRVDLSSVPWSTRGTLKENFLFQCFFHYGAAHVRAVHRLSVRRVPVAPVSRTGTIESCSSAPPLP